MNDENNPAVKTHGRKNSYFYGTNTDSTVVVFHAPIPG
jgi:hypothetical protein